MNNIVKSTFFDTNSYDYYCSTYLNLNYKILVLLIVMAQASIANNVTGN